MAATVKLTRDGATYETADPELVELYKKAGWVEVVPKAKRQTKAKETSAKE